jgi:hypothetical protein
MTRLSTKTAEILSNILDKTRLAKGWNPYDDASQNLAIQTWFEILEAAKIEPQSYNELYRRACLFRAEKIADGGNAPEISAELLVAFWKPLQTEIRQNRILSGKFLGTNAASVCQYCFGSGWRQIQDGGFYKTTARCDHGEPVWTEAELRWRELQENKSKSEENL